MANTKSYITPSGFRPDQISGGSIKNKHFPSPLPHQSRPISQARIESSALVVPGLEVDENQGRPGCILQFP